jgi:hypothetical protein
MIINHSLGFVFVHVPKAAGTSISRIFTAFSTYRDQEIGGTPMGEVLQPFFKRRYGLAKHSTATEIRDVMGEQRFSNYFTFAFVRNPYTRAFSTFNYLHRQQDHKDLKALNLVRRLETFADFLRSEYFEGEGMDRILQPQTFWTALPSPTPISFVGSVESIDADMDYTLRKASKPGKKNGAVPKKVQARNRSTNEPNRLWVLLQEDPEGERIIFDRYKDDFETFGYERFSSGLNGLYDERRLRDRGDKPFSTGELANLPPLKQSDASAKNPAQGAQKGGKKSAMPEHTDE